MTKDSITLKYEGPALKTGAIEIASLGPALIAVNELFSITNDVANGKNRKIKIKVQSFEKGSFDIILSVLITPLEQALLFFNKDAVNGALNLYEILGMVTGGVGIIGLGKLFKGQVPTVVSEDKIKNTITLGDNNNNIVVVNKPVYNLYCNTDVAKYLADLTAPVTVEGVESLQFVHKNQTTQSISKEEARYFSNLKKSHEEIESSSTRVTVSFKKLAIPMSLNSKYSLNGMEFFAKISDKDFNEKISKGHRIGLADRLDVELLTTTIKTLDKTQHEYEITKVYEHILGMTQTEMDL